MTFRKRTQNFVPYTSGTVKYLPTDEIFYSYVPTGYQECGDIAGNRNGPNGLEIVRVQQLEVGRLSGKEPYYPVYEYQAWPFTNQSQAGAHWDLGVIPGITQSANDVLAATNPSRPEVSLPNLLVELKDVPSMVLGAGRKHRSSRKSNSTAEYNFGWELLIRDVLSIFDFTSHVNNRVREINASYKRGGRRVKRTVWSGHKTGIDTGVTFHSSGAYVRGNVVWTTSGKRWVTTRWVPESSIDTIPPADDVLRAARLAVHGWDLSLGGVSSFAWEALPWSWFADYFLNVGDFLNARRNSVGIVSSNTCVMTHMRTIGQQVIDFNNPWLKDVVPAKSLFETKSRAVAGAALFTASEPFLSTRQLLTLSSIAMSKG